MSKRTVTVELTEEQAEFLMRLCKHQHDGALARMQKAKARRGSRSDVDTVWATAKIHLAVDDALTEAQHAKDYAANAAEV